MNTNGTLLVAAAKDPNNHVIILGSGSLNACLTSYRHSYCSCRKCHSLDVVLKKLEMLRHTSSRLGYHIRSTKRYIILLYRRVINDIFCCVLVYTVIDCDICIHDVI